jgi:hypothetical protein
MRLSLTVTSPVFTGAPMPRGLSRLFLSRRQAAVLQGEAQAMGMEGAKRRKGQGTGAKILKNGINLGSSALGG